MDCPMYNEYMTCEQYYRLQQQIKWYNEYQPSEALTSQDVILDENIPIVNYDDDRILNSLTYCFNCDINCVIQLNGFTQCIKCENILITDLKQVRRTYSSKVKNNKLNNFTKVLNEYLQVFLNIY